jgi:methionyl-tRNA formyltransferase
LTIFRPTNGLDEGPIVLQKTVEIGPDDTLGTVYFDRLFPMGVAALLEAADLVASGQSTERPQDETHATYEGWCRDPEAQINWHAHLDAIYNHIRGCNPSPGAWTTIGGCRVRLFDARKHVARRFGDVAGKIGEICTIGDQSLQIAVQGGRLEVFKVRADGGEKMTAAAFAAAAGLKLGSNVSTAIDPLYS